DSIPQIRDRDLRPVWNECPAWWTPGDWPYRNGVPESLLRSASRPCKRRARPTGWHSWPRHRQCKSGRPACTDQCSFCRRIPFLALVLIEGGACKSDDYYHHSDLDNVFAVPARVAMDELH